MGVARRKRTNSLREMGEWSSGGCEFWSQHLPGEARHILESHHARTAVDAPLSLIPAARRVAPSQRSEPPREHLGDVQVSAAGAGHKEQPDTYLLGLCLR